MEENQVHYRMEKYSGNPVLKADMCPYPAELTFNAGVIRKDDTWFMIFRNDRDWVANCDFRHMDLGMAYSKDGLRFTVYNRPVFKVSELGDPEITRLYDVRLSEIDGRYFATMAVETKHGLRAGIGETEDFIHLKMLSMSLPDNRNLVLFPERIQGRYVRLERPFTLYNNQNYDIWISYSPDLIHWGESRLLLRHEDVRLGNAKIGPGTPPVRTPYGWLSLIHAVDYNESRGKNGYEPAWKKRYYAYALLQDLQDPSRLLGVSDEPVIVPDSSYELSGGFRNNVVFPTGLIKINEKTVRAYYGAADTVMAVAEGSVEALVRACLHT